MDHTEQEQELRKIACNTIYTSRQSIGGLIDRHGLLEVIEAVHDLAWERLGRKGGNYEGVTNELLTGFENLMNTARVIELMDQREPIIF